MLRLVSLLLRFAEKCLLASAVVFPFSFDLGREKLTTDQFSKVHVTLVAFETFKQPDGVDAFVSARRKTPLNIAKEVGAAYRTSSSSSTLRRKSASDCDHLIRHFAKS